jgi:two-component system, LytTR family, sensor histidine kinase AlgZ
MHPIVGHRRRLGLYAIAWIPLALLLGYLLKASGLSTAEAAALMLPLAPLYAAMCLVAWYPTRATPLHTSGFTRLVVTQLAAAGLVSSAWTFVALAYTYALSFTERFQHIRDRAALDKIFFGVGVLLYLLSVAVHYLLAAMQRSQEAEQHASEAQLLARDAELRALKAQINPHFLFNSLNSISALTTIDPLKAREMCITLADFLRSTLGLGEKSLIPLEEEMALIRRFLAVEKVRFGSRLQIEESIDPASLNCLVPPLLLQPLVENAIAHGVANLPEGGWIRIHAACNADSQIHLTVENNFDPEYKPKRSRGIGMSNVRERLLTRYGKEGNFTARVDGDLFRVSLSLPKERSTHLE